MVTTLLMLCGSLAAQSTVGWLRYAIPPDPPRYHGLPHAVVLLGNGAGEVAPEEEAAADELDRGLGHMVAGTDVVLHRFDLRQDAIILGTTEALHRARIGHHLHGWTEKPLPEEGFRIVHLRRGIREWYVLQGGSPRAELWAAFRFAALVAEDQQLPEELIDTPQLSLRALDLGPAESAVSLLLGASQSNAANAPARPKGFVRLLASTGLNALLVNSSSNEVLTQIADLLRPYGLRLWVSTQNNLAASTTGTIPNLGGIAIRMAPHPSAAEFKLTVDAANASARLLARTGGTVLLEDALGEPMQKPAPPSGNAPSLPLEQRVALLRELESNVVLSSAATLPYAVFAGLASPHFGLLPAQPQTASLDVLPLGTGSLAYPAQAWSSVLHTMERGSRGEAALASLLRGPEFAQTRTGLVSHLSAQQAAIMLEQPLLLANLYAFGRLAWSPALTPEAITEEWARQTWGDDMRAHGVASSILLASAAATVQAGAPLGFPWLFDDAGNPSPARATDLFVVGKPMADKSGVGADRSVRGTDELALYPDTQKARLADPVQSPPQTLLLLHHLPWRHALPDGHSVAQHLYDASFAGAATAANNVDAWEGTLSLIDPARYTVVHDFLLRVAQHASIAREVFTEWVQRTSGVPDLLGFVGSHAGRTEAEATTLTGYRVRQSTAEAASGAADVTCHEAEACAATMTFHGEENVYRITVGYKDEHLRGSFELLVNGERKASWQEKATQYGEPGGSASAALERFVANGVRLRTNDAVVIRSHPGRGGETPLDFLEITRDPRWN